MSPLFVFLAVESADADLMAALRQEGIAARTPPAHRQMLDPVMRLDGAGRPPDVAPVAQSPRRALEHLQGPRGR